MARSKAPLVICPYFEKFSDYGIRCEGLSLDSYIDQHFPTRRERERWTATYCCVGTNYECCPLARLLGEYYNGGGKHE